MRTPLENNSLANMRQTLRDMASTHRQKVYKSSVPFVHVPIELLEQWSNYSRMLHDVDWFQGLFTQSQLAALASFSSTVASGAEQLGKPMPDVPEILSTTAWLGIVEAAGQVISFVPAPDDVD